MTLSPTAQSFSWLVQNFVDNTDGVTDAIAVSADGILLANSKGLAQAQSEQFAAITSGLTSLTNGAARCFAYDGVEQIIVEMRGGYLFVTSISQGAALGVLADRDCEIGLVAYEMTLMVRRAGEVLTPDLIAELKNLLTI